MTRQWSRHIFRRSPGGFDRACAVHISLLSLFQPNAPSHTITSLYVLSGAPDSAVYHTRLVRPLGQQLKEPYQRRVHSQGTAKCRPLTSFTSTELRSRLMSLAGEDVSTLCCLLQTLYRSTNRVSVSLRQGCSCGARGNELVYFPDLPPEFGSTRLRSALLLTLCWWPVAGMPCGFVYLGCC